MYQFKRTQFLKANLNQVWDFISSPKNLKVITPDYMGFDILSEDLPDKMHSGMIISYQVKPMLNIPTKWVTEITHVKEGKFFVDEQRIGPYKLWHHQHHIEAVEGGTNMLDIVSYQPPFGLIGKISNSIIIKAKLEEIFNYRKKALEEIFH